MIVGKRERIASRRTVIDGQNKIFSRIMVVVNQKILSSVTIIGKRRKFSRRDGGYRQRQKILTNYNGYSETVVTKTD